MGTAIPVTIFPNTFAATKRQLLLALDELAALIDQTVAPSKDALPLLKLATFGDKKSPKGSLRYDANLLQVHGVETDYDGGTIPFEDAVARLEDARVTAIIYTSPSHSPESPRWRTLMPLGGPIAPAERTGMVDRANAILGGGLARESWTLSQSYYFGRVNDHFRIEVIEGELLDTRYDFDGVKSKRPFDEEEAISAIVAGTNYHEATTGLAGYWALHGVSVDTAIGRLLEIFDRAVTRDGRWQRRRDDVERCVRAIYDKHTAKPAAERQRFGTQRGALTYYKAVKDEIIIPVRLANFSARIVEDQIIDDGAAEARRFQLTGQLEDGTALPLIVVPAKAFSGVSWIAERWGARPIVHAGAGCAMICEGIQTISGRVPVRSVFAHVGWRQINGYWIYLHAGGGLGANGPLKDVTVELPGELAWYELPCTHSDVRAAVRAALGLFDLNPTVAAAVWRGTLGEFCPITFSVFVAGRTGAFKSALTGVAQAHWGSRWDGVQFPANWSGTANSLEKLAFLAKDAMLCIDDFAPSPSPRGMAELHEKSERLLRAAGNQAGRSRMSQDASLRTTYWPRGLLTASGEDVPTGHSLRARMAIEQLGPNDIDPAKLSELQQAAAAGTLAEAMGGFIQWIAAAADAGGLGVRLKQRQAELRGSVSAEHRRTPDIIASLMLGAESFLEFAVKVGAIGQDDADARRGRIWSALAARMATQAVEQREEDPVRVFIGALSELLASGEAHLADPAHEEPSTDPAAFGWRQQLGSDGRTIWLPQGEQIGWVKDDEVWLLPDVSINAVNRLLRGQGKGISVTRMTLRRRLEEAGFLVKSSAGKAKETVRIGAATVRVFAIASSVVLGSPVTSEALADAVS